MSDYILTSEYVSSGHPDKVADQISDAILDYFLHHDPNAKVACETMVKGYSVVLAGEITSSHPYNTHVINNIVRTAIANTGYDSVYPSIFNTSNVQITHNISTQSHEINSAVDTADGIMAGDQGFVFGYATTETPTYMPLAIYLAKKIIDTATKMNAPRFSLRPDMKSQVSIRYNSDGIPLEVDSIVFSTCHTEDTSLADVREYFDDTIMPSLIDSVPQHIGELITAHTRFYINPAGAWHVGGPETDCGLTGRKIVVDQYGADCEIGGGAFSGKDSSKIDRSAAYMARYIAIKTIKQYPLASKIKVQLAYSIGYAEPVSVRIYNPDNGNPFTLDDIGMTIYDLRPTAIINRFGLTNPIFWNTAHNGHFGNPELPWENIQ